MMHQVTLSIENIVNDERIKYEIKRKASGRFY